MTDDLKTWPCQVCSSDDPWLTLTILSQCQIRSLRLLCRKIGQTGDFKHT